MMTTPLMPGSRGERDLQERYGNQKRAEGFYKNQMLSYVNPQMRTFIARQEMFFLSPADGHGECDVSFRAGETGFVNVLNEKLLTRRNRTSCLFLRREPLCSDELSAWKWWVRLVLIQRRPD